MKLIIIKYTFLFFIPILFSVQQPNWKVKSSAITFKIKNAGLTVNGSFSNLDATINFNPLKPEDANIKASVNANTINTGIEMRDNHLKKPEYFDVEKYPKISIQSTKIEKTGPVSFIGTFKLTMKGTSKEIKIPFNFLKLADKTELKGSFTLNRLDYNIGGNSLTLGDNVTVNIVLQVTE